MNPDTISILSKYDINTEVLDLSNKNIEGILDLNKFEYLKKIICLKNKITDLQYNLDKLIYLDCSNNLIKRLIGVYDTINYLNCSSNPIEELYYPFDVKPKSYPKTLKKIIFGYGFNCPVDNLNFGVEKT